MMQRTIQGKRIRSLRYIDGFNVETLEIGVQDINSRAEKIGLKSFEEIIVPSPDFGPCCEKNANGYSYADKTKEKKRRYICTNWIHPYGNENADSIPCDIYRECYPRIEVAPTEIGLTLHLNEKNERYIIACLTPEIREKHLISTINLFLELFGECTIFECLSTIGDEIKRHRCNWEILPPGEAPGKHFAKQLRLHGERTDTFNMDRLYTLDRCGAKDSVEGINGFAGYYAYIFDTFCVLESAKYGNATYIIAKENWEKQSQKTKKELLDENAVIKKLIHNEHWKRDIFYVINKMKHEQHNTL